MNATQVDWLYDPTIIKLVISVIGIIVIVLLIRVIEKITRRYIKDKNTRYRSRKVLSFFGYVAAIFFILSVFGNRLGGLHIVLGMAGAGIAFSLQEVIASIAGWFAISFANFFKTGDRVQLGGIKGDVIDIGILRTTIMEVGEWVQGDQYNGRVVRVANSFVFKEPVYNYSGDFPFLWDEISIPIRYNSNDTAVRELLLTVAREVVGEYTRIADQSWNDMVRKFLIEDAQTAPMIMMTADENWMTYSLRYVVDFKSRRSTKDRLYTRIIDEIAKSGDSISIASTSTEIKVTK